MTELIKVVAIIVELVPHAMTQQFEGGGFARYDASVLRILQPDNLKDTLLTIYHSQPLPDHSPLRKANNRLTFEIEEYYLSGNYVLFTKALRNMEIVKQTGTDKHEG